MDKKIIAPSLIDTKSLLRKIHRKLTRKRTWRKFRLDRVVLSRFTSMAVNRYGYPQDLVAYIYYPSAKVIKVSGSYWLVARGVSVGGDLAADYIGDIIAIKITKPHRGITAKELADQAIRLIDKHQNLSASLLAFRVDGTALHHPNNGLAISVCRQLSMILFSISVRQKSTRLQADDLIAGSRLSGQDIFYRPEAVNIIVGILLDVLGE